MAKTYDKIPEIERPIRKALKLDQYQTEFCKDLSDD